MQHTCARVRPHNFVCVMHDRRSGENNAWLAKGDLGLKAMSNHLACDVNGVLFKALAREINHSKEKCINYFKDGRQLALAV
jgi:hypothetical protein